MTLDADAFDDQLGERLLAACGDRFESVRSLPLVSGGSLFGSAYLFLAHGTRSGPSPVAAGLVDLAAIALDSQTKIQKLGRTAQALRESREALARAEKLRALGQMAAGVSHDLKNVLNPLSLYIQVAQRSLDKGNVEGAKHSLGDMKQVLTRGIETLERLRDYSRQAPEARASEVDLNLLVREASEIAKPRMAGRAVVSRMTFKLGDPPKVPGKPAEIVSAIVNLIVNAIDAMPKGGTITLKTGAARDGAWVQVADDGPGMTREVEERVFDPFFTTKGEEGTGLGLAMVFASMQRHGGSVTLETAPGKGAAFTLWFPTGTSTH
jgi:signal transduction histidine kinase